MQNSRMADDTATAQGISAKQIRLVSGTKRLAKKEKYFEGCTQLVRSLSLETFMVVCILLFSPIRSVMGEVSCRHSEHNESLTAGYSYVCTLEGQPTTNLTNGTALTFNQQGGLLKLRGQSCDGTNRIVGVKTLPYTAMGRVYSTFENESYGCSGFLVGTGKMITAGHCLWTEADGPAIDVHVQLSNNNNPGDWSFAIRRATCYGIFRGWGEERRSRDIGMIDFPQKVRRGVIRPGPAGWDPQASLAACGYRGVDFDRLFCSEGSAYRGYSRELSSVVLARLPSWGGQSGGPIFWWPRSWELLQGQTVSVGILTAGGIDGTCPTVVTPFDRGVVQHINNWVDLPPGHCI
jgi:V8-like Glu-specific endopeptidase